MGKTTQTFIIKRTTLKAEHQAHMVASSQDQTMQWHHQDQWENHIKHILKAKVTSTNQVCLQPQV